MCVYEINYEDYQRYKFESPKKKTIFFKVPTDSNPTSEWVRLILKHISYFIILLKYC
jgi:hypothetical protein